MKNNKHFKKVTIGFFFFFAFICNISNLNAVAAVHNVSPILQQVYLNADILERKVVLIKGVWYEVVFNRTTGKIISKVPVK